MRKKQEKWISILSILNSKGFYDVKKGQQIQLNHQSINPEEPITYTKISETKRITKANFGIPIYIDNQQNIVVPSVAFIKDI